MLLYEIWNNLYECNTSSTQELNAKHFSTIDDISIYAANDSQKKLHLIISDNQQTVFKELHVKCLSISNQKWIINDLQSNNFIDIFCNITIRDNLHAPFLSFCLDLITEIEKEPKKIQFLIKKIFSRWKYFWENNNEIEFSENWLKGLYGELYILKILLLEVNITGILSWQGPYGKDIDFQGYNCGLEVKTTSSKPTVITINNIKQLDKENFKSLFLTVVTLEISKNGASINKIIEQIIDLLTQNEPELLDPFYERLTSSGYFSYDKNKYEEFLFNVSSVDWYLINDDFPSLTYSKIKNILDYRIKNIKYQIELLDLHNYCSNDVIVKNFLKNLIGNDQR